MNINKRLDRVKQWAGEKIGAESKTSVSDEFRSLETEMQLRHDGMDKIHKSTTAYIKSLSKRDEGDDREKVLPVARLGQTLANHGDDFEPDSEFGNCLIAMGRTNERIARVQETYTAHATTGWLESLERSLVQMKEYQAARKKLEGRRLAYDASLSKMQKSKKEDFRSEEELRSQKAKYEESSEDVFRRMQDIKEAEEDSVADLGAFLDAELEYYDRCRDELMRLKRDWPAAQKRAQSTTRANRSRSNTAHSYKERYAAHEEPIPEFDRPAIRSSARVSSGTYLSPTTSHEAPPPLPSNRPHLARAHTIEPPRRDITPPGRQSSFASDAGVARDRLRPTSRIRTADLFGDPSDDSAAYSGTDRSPRAGSVSPATSAGSGAGGDVSRKGSWTNLRGGVNGNVNAAQGVVKKGPPPPPPSRGRKIAPPPPPPMKRAY
ncbi:hypothetical protein VF21_01405 [Pseudogymnoascus sp. 05NY08]|nr:hypothetical protein VF21_01405 [Pseudogymnoascus sp. 05NY08]